MMEMIRNGLIFDMMTWIPARRGDPTLMTETIGDEIFDTHLSIVKVVAIRRRDLRKIR